jgi:hypothetical protein
MQLWAENKYLKEIERVFEVHGIDCSIGIVLGDMIMKSYKRFNPIDPYYLTCKHKPFKNYINIIERQDIDMFPHCQKLIAHTLVKYFLDVYVDIIYKEFKEDNF